MKANDVFHLSIRAVVRTMQDMTADMTPEQLHWNPPGTAHSVASTYAHAALATDWQIYSLFEGGAPRFTTDWAGKTGVSDPTVAQTLEWAQSVRVDMPVFQSYAEAIFDEAVAYCDQLSDEDLSRPIDMSVINAGERSLGWCITMVVVNHLNQLAGEIAAAKGMQGLVGYAF